MNFTSKGHIKQYEECWAGNTISISRKVMKFSCSDHYY